MHVVVGPLFKELSAAEREFLGGPTALPGIMKSLARRHPSNTAESHMAKEQIAKTLKRLVPESADLQLHIDRANRAERALAPRIDPPLVRTLGFGDHPPTFAGSGFQWVQTAVWGEHGIDVSNSSNGNGRIAAVTGRAHDLGGTRVVFTVGMKSYFAIKFDDLLSYGPALNPTFTNAPTVSVGAVVNGYSGLGFILLFSMEDNWAKCRLKMRHDVSQIAQTPSGLPLPALVLGSAEYPGYTLIDEEGNNKWVSAFVDYTNYALPPCNYSLPVRSEHVLASVEIAYEIELEGVAEVNFAELFYGTEKGPTMMMAHDFAPIGYANDAHLPI